MSKLHKLLIATVSTLFFGLYGYFFIYSVLLPRYPQFNNTMLLDSGIALALLVASVLAAKSRVWHWLARLKGQRYIIALCLCVICGLIFYVGWALAIDPSKSGWDPLTMYEAAVNLITPHAVFSDQRSYFIYFPNNLGLLGMMAGWFTIARTINLNFIDASVLLNALFLSGSVCMTYLTARRILGKRGTVMSLLLCLVFIALSPWTRTLYSDTVGTFFVITSFYLIVHIKKTSELRVQLLLIGILGLVGAAGYLIKPTTIFVLLAALIVHATSIIRLLQKRNSRLYTSIAAILLPASFLLVFWAVSAGVLNALNTHSDAMPLSHFAMMGLTTVCTPSECRYGAWNLPDALEQAKFTAMPDYAAFTRHVTKRRLKQLGVGGYTEFLSNKGAWIIGDGSFYTYHEGVEATALFVHNGSIYKPIRSALSPFGLHYNLYQNAVQVVWVFTLLCVLAPSLLRRLKPTSEVIVIRLALTMLLVFLLLFEARSRYLYLYVPLFILLASYGFEELLSSFGSRKKRS